MAELADAEPQRAEQDCYMEELKGARDERDRYKRELEEARVERDTYRTELTQIRDDMAYRTSQSAKQTAETRALLVTSITSEVEATLRARLKSYGWILGLMVAAATVGGAWTVSDFVQSTKSDLHDELSQSIKTGIDGELRAQSESLKKLKSDAEVGWRTVVERTGQSIHETGKMIGKQEQQIVDLSSKTEKAKQAFRLTNDNIAHVARTLMGIVVELDALKDMKVADLKTRVALLQQVPIDTVQLKSLEERVKRLEEQVQEVTPTVRPGIIGSTGSYVPFPEYTAPSSEGTSIDALIRQLEEIKARIEDASSSPKSPG